jgi:hypothetical protein
MLLTIISLLVVAFLSSKIGYYFSTSRTKVSLYGTILLFVACTVIHYIEKVLSVLHIDVSSNVGFLIFILFEIIFFFLGVILFLRKKKKM